MTDLNFIKRDGGRIVICNLSGVAWHTDDSLDTALTIAKNTGIPFMVNPVMTENQPGSLFIFSRDIELPLDVSKSLGNIPQYKVRESIDINGKIELPLSEEEINNVLKFVFKLQPALVYILLKNALENNIHERNLRNLLKNTGLTVKISEDILNNQNIS